MKKTILLWLMFLIPALLNAAELTVIVKGLRSNKGQVIIGVYPDAETFKEPKSTDIFKNDVPIHNRQAKATFELEKGIYAVSVIHDENKNKKFDLSLLRIPKEGWGFSRDAKPSPITPDFEDAAFLVDEEKVTHVIHMDYWGDD